MHELSERPSLFEFSLVPEPPCLILDLRGELDLCSARQMPQDAYSYRRDLTTVLVDLGDLTFCDVAGLRALLTFGGIHEAQCRSVFVVRANPFIWRLMRLCGVTNRLGFARPSSPIPV
jgi:anti-anti-sigma factor